MCERVLELSAAYNGRERDRVRAAFRDLDRLIDDRTIRAAGRTSYSTAAYTVAAASLYGLTSGDVNAIQRAARKVSKAKISFREYNRS